MPTVLKTSQKSGNGFITRPNKGRFTAGIANTFSNYYAYNIGLVLFATWAKDHD